MIVQLQSELSARAACQYGVVATHQLRNLVSTASIRHELASGRWCRIYPGVFISATAHQGPEAIAMARLLRAGPGAVVSHTSALTLWDVAQGHLDPLHIIRMRGSNGVNLRDHDIVRHETRRMPEDHVVVHQGFPITTPARTLCDIAATEPVARLERWLDRALFLRITNMDLLMDACADLHKRGRKGIEMIANLVIARGRDYVAPESGLESRLNSLLARSDLPPVRRQVQIGGEHWLARVDFLVDRTSLVLEVQSNLYHASFSARQHDARRLDALQAAGYDAVELWEDDIWSRPNDAIAKIRNALSTHRQERT